MAMQHAAAKKADRKPQLEAGKKEVKEQAKKAVLQETAQAGGLAAQRAALKPPLPWFGGGDSARKDPKKDPAQNPDSESEHVKGASYEAVKGTAFVKGQGDATDIDPNDVSQGRLGDCYFVAALAALAKQSPETLRKVITDNGDGTYVVHFHEGGDVVVDSRFPMKNGQVQFAEEGDQDQEKGAELWVMLIEKAWAKLKGGYEVIRGSKVRMSSTDAMQAISGKDTRTIRPAAMSGDQLIEALADAEAKGWPVTIGVKNVSDAEEVKKVKATGLVPNHAFAVMSVDKGAKTITVYNPWGKEYKVPPLTMDTLKSFVSSIHVNKD